MTDGLEESDMAQGQDRIMIVGFDDVAAIAPRARMPNGLVV
jgi:hypothetical protein